MIKRLKHNQIDKKKWDVLQNNYNKVYLMSWYLDIVSPNWEALVYGDYDFLMPLTITRKKGIRIIVQPPFCQQLGITGKEQNIEVENQFITYIKNHFFWVYWQGNSRMVSEGKTSKSNYTLSLANPYNKIYSSYKGNHKRNTKIFTKSCSEIITIDVDAAFDFINKNARFAISSKSWAVLYNIINQAQKRETSIFFASINRNQVEAVSVFIHHNSSTVHLASASNKSGYKHSAQYGLIDYFIRKYSQTETILDFEGSSIKSIAYFNEGFGAIKEKYPCFKHSIIPWK